MLKRVVSWEVSVNFDLSTFVDTLECSESKTCCFYFFQKQEIAAILFFKMAAI